MCFNACTTLQAAGKWQQQQQPSHAALPAPRAPSAPDASHASDPHAPQGEGGTEEGAHAYGPKPGPGIKGQSIGSALRLAAGLKGASSRAKSRLQGKGGEEVGGRPPDEEGMDGGSAEEWTRNTLALVTQVGVGTR
jgi:hypothetical protein